MAVSALPRRTFLRTSTSRWDRPTAKTGRPPPAANHSLTKVGAGPWSAGRCLPEVATPNHESPYGAVVILGEHQFAKELASTGRVSACRNSVSPERSLLPPC